MISFNDRSIKEQDRIMDAFAGLVVSFGLAVGSLGLTREKSGEGVDNKPAAVSNDPQPNYVQPDEAQ